MATHDGSEQIRESGLTLNDHPVPEATMQEKLRLTSDGLNGDLVIADVPGGYLVDESAYFRGQDPPAVQLLGTAHRETQLGTDGPVAPKTADAGLPMNRRPSAASASRSRAPRATRSIGSSA